MALGIYISLIIVFRRQVGPTVSKLRFRLRNEAVAPCQKDQGWIVILGEGLETGAIVPT